MPVLQFRDTDARIAYLATVYHLGRPGSETDPRTLQTHEYGLRSVRAALEPQLGRAVVEAELSAFQLVKLDEAILGVTNELKQFGIANGQSSVPEFAKTVGWLYPETTEDPGAAMDVVQHAVMLHRRLGPVVTEAHAELAAAVEEEQQRRDAERGRWWQVWRRGKDGGAEGG